jgi:hypothetical protein
MPRCTPTATPSRAYRPPASPRARPPAGGTCDNNSSSLFPRTNAYAVAAVKSFGTGGNDRLLVIGGGDNDNNVFYSDDCGATWACNDASEFFVASRYRWVVDVPGVSIPYAPLIFGGGYSEPDGPGMLIPSIGVFVTSDGGITWNRPLCTDQTNPDVTCTNSVPDEKRGGVAWAQTVTRTTPQTLQTGVTTWQLRRRCRRRCRRCRRPLHSPRSLRRGLLLRRRRHRLSPHPP